jgi:hypothetical protein
MKDAVGREINGRDGCDVTDLAGISAFGGNSSHPVNDHNVNISSRPLELLLRSIRLHLAPRVADRCRVAQRRSCTVPISHRELLLNSGYVDPHRRHPAATLRQNNSTGKISKACRVIFSDFPKIFSFRPDPNQLISFHVSPTEGRIAIVTDAGWDAVDATALGVTRDGRAGWRKTRERSAARRRPALKRTAKPCGPGIRC